MGFLLLQYRSVYLAFWGRCRYAAGPRSSVARADILKAIDCESGDHGGEIRPLRCEVICWNDGGARGLVFGGTGWNFMRKCRRGRKDDYRLAWEFICCLLIVGGHKTERTDGM